MSGDDENNSEYFNRTVAHGCNNTSAHGCSLSSARSTIFRGSSIISSDSFSARSLKSSALISGCSLRISITRSRQRSKSKSFSQSRNLSKKRKNENHKGRNPLPAELRREIIPIELLPGRKVLPYTQYAKEINWYWKILRSLNLFRPHCLLRYIAGPSMPATNARATSLLVSFPPWQ